jgi:MFS family permease
LAVIVLAQQQLHAHASLIGLIFSIGSASGLLGSALSPVVNRRWQVNQILTGAALTIAGVSAILAIAVNPAMLIFGIAFVFLAVPIVDVTQMSYRLSLTPDKFQGRANSVFQMFFFSSYSLGLIVGGFFLSLLGARIELWIISAGFALCAFVPMFSLARNAHL